MQDLRSRKQIETARFWWCLVVFTIIGSATTFGVDIRPDLNPKGMVYLFAVQTGIVLLLTLTAVSLLAPEGFLTRPIIRIFPEQVHSFITWGVVYSMVVFLLVVLPILINAKIDTFEEDYPHLVAFVNVYFGWI